MNIFILSTLPDKAAKYHTDKHVVKMQLEYAQILSTVIQTKLDTTIDALYKPTHKSHMCTKWAYESRANFMWLIQLLKHLTQEYTLRYNKVHKVASMIPTFDMYALRLDFEHEDMTEFVQCVKPEYKQQDAVRAYRHYMLCEKAELIAYSCPADMLDERLEWMQHLD